MNKNNDNSFSDFLFLGKLVLLVAFFIFALVFIYKSVGFTGFITFIGFCALFTPLFLTKPAVFNTSRRRRDRGASGSFKDNSSSYSKSVKLVLLVAFFIFALVFIYKSGGFAGFITFIGFCALFTPLFLTKPATFVERNDPFLDPVNKGWLGNIFTRK